MQCLRCQHPNSEAAKFCEECGSKLIQVCPSCGHAVSPTAKFCPECGISLTGRQRGKRRKGEKGKRKTASDSDPQTPDSSRLRTPNFPGLWTPPHLADRIRAEREAMEARGATDGERKTITALFADIKDSTALIEDLDPEEARHIIDPALSLMMDAVHRYEGYVTQSLGDGIFALFGAPIAHEDHP
ncbi:MAG: zinc ribbon domain-containing protein, partial [Deltaproteobacteria bacterium]|nr:zinc ribbon domain-containing protein [Deltaproteobacteria bacterium]